MRFITLFTYGFRPLKDHILGLLFSLNEEKYYKMIIFSDTKDPDILKAIDKIDKISGPLVCEPEGTIH